MDRQAKIPYAKPGLIKHDNLREITFDQPEWHCSVPTNNGVGNNGCDNGNHGGNG